MGSSNDSVVWYVNLLPWMVISHKWLNHSIWIKKLPTHKFWGEFWSLVFGCVAASQVCHISKEKRAWKLFVLSSSGNSKGILLLPTFNTGNTHNLWVSPLKPETNCSVTNEGGALEYPYVFNLWKDMISVHPDH